MAKTEANKIPGPQSSKRVESNKAMTGPKPGSFHITKGPASKEGQTGGKVTDYAIDDAPKVTKVGSDKVASPARKKVSFGAP